MAETYFKKTFKGYDTEQVDAFIISLSDTYERNEKENAEKLRAAEAEMARLREELADMRIYIEETAKLHEDELKSQKDEYDALYAEIGEKMVLADTRAAEIIRNAEKEANLILTQARQNSELEAKAVRSQAEEEANKLIEDTRVKCAEISSAAEEFRLQQYEIHRSISETEKRFGDALSKLREGFGSEQ